MTQPPPPRDPPPLLRQAKRRRLLTPFRAAMLVTVVGSGLLIAYGIVDRTATQIPMLAAGLAVLGLSLGAIAVACVVTIVRAGRHGHAAKAFWAALAGGAAVVAAAGCLAAAVVMAMVWGSATGS